MSITKLPDGRYAIRVRGYGSDRGEYTTFEPGTPYRAVQTEHARRVAVRDEAKAVHDGTVADLARDYIKSKLPEDGSEAGREHEREAQIVADICADEIGAVVASELRSYHFDDWQIRLKRGYTDAKDKKHRANSDATIDRKANVLRALLHYAVRRGKLDVSPLRPGDLERKVPSNKTTPIWFTQEEWSRFIGALDDSARFKAYVAKRRVTAINDPNAKLGRAPDSDATAQRYAHLLEWREIWWTLLLTGSRLSEILQLRWEQIDLRAGTISVDQSKTDYVKPTYIGLRLKEILESLPRGVGGAFVFRRPDGDAHSTMEAGRAFKVYRELAGLPRKLTIHKLRHTAASWAIQSGASLKQVQEMLGHRSINTTMKYAHIGEESVRKALSSVERMAKGEK